MKSIDAIMKFLHLQQNARELEFFNFISCFEIGLSRAALRTLDLEKHLDRFEKLGLIDSA